MQEGSEEVVLCSSLTCPSYFNGVWESNILTLGNVCDILHKKGMTLLTLHAQILHVLSIVTQCTSITCRGITLDLANPKRLE